MKNEINNEMMEKENIIDVKRIVRTEMDSIADRYFKEGGLPDDLNADYELVWKYVKGVLNGAMSREEFEKYWCYDHFKKLVEIRYTKKVWLDTLKEGKMLKLTSGQEVAELSKEGDNIKVEYYTIFYHPKGTRSEGEVKYYEASTDKEILDVCFDVKSEINKWW